MRIACWNANGLAHTRLDNRPDHEDQLTKYLQQFQVICIQETRNNDTVTDVLGGSYHYFHHPTTQRTPGHGMTVCIQKSWSNACLFDEHNDDIQLSWVKLPDCYVAFVYVPPSMIGDNTSTAFERAQVLSTLHAEVVRRQALCPVIIMGDLNAHIGALPDACTTLPRRVQFPRVNRWGTALMSMATQCDLMAATGRGPDNGGASWVGTNRRHSRIDHALVQTDMWEHVSSKLHGVKFGSDHKPLEVHVTLSGALPVALTPAHPPYLKWDPDKAPAYSMAAARTPLWGQFAAAVTHNDTAQATAVLHAVIWDAATQAHMVVHPHRHRTTGRAGIRMTAEAMQVKQRLKAKRRSGPPPDPVQRQQWLQQEQEDLRWWRSYAAAERKRRKNMPRVKLMLYLRTKPATWWRVIKGAKPHGADCHVNKESLRGWYLQKFVQREGPATAQAQPASQPTRSGQHAPPEHGDLLHDVTAMEVVDMFGRWAAGKCPGMDGIPREFLAKAAVEDGTTTQCPFAQPLAQLLSLALQQGQVPRDWKTKQIRPVYKRGAKSVPANYRPIAVSCLMYTCVTGILGERMAKAAPHVVGEGDSSGLNLDSQFAFRRGLSTHHAHVLVQTCCDYASIHRQPLALVKLDIEQAYDTVLRGKLWNAMCRVGLPWRFVQFVRELYREADYVVRVNGQCAEPFESNVGVQQGCALSPMLYSIYIKDALHNVHTQCLGIGVPLGPDATCTHANYADDILGTVLGVDHVPQFMQVVEEEFAKLGQQINRDKSKVLLVSRGLTGPTPPPTVVAGVPVVKAMKVLGVWFYSHGRVGENVYARVQAGDCTVRAILTRCKQLKCHKDTEIVLELLQARLRPVLLWGAPVWGCYPVNPTGSMDAWGPMMEEDPFKHHLQAPWLSLLKHALLLPDSTAHWIALSLGGYLPVRSYIVLEFCTFWNGLLRQAEEGNSLLQAVVTAQVQWSNHAACANECWLGQWCHVMDGPAVGTGQWGGQLRGGEPLPQDAVRQAMIESYENMIHSYGDPFMPDCLHRRIAMHFHSCDLAPCMGKKPAHLRWHLPQAVRRAWLQFMACSAPVPVRWPRKVFGQPIGYQLRWCDKCLYRCLGDEAHALLQCPVTADVRARFAGAVSLNHSDVQSFLVANRNNKQCAMFVWRALAAYQAATGYGYTEPPPGRGGAVLSLPDLEELLMLPPRPRNA